MNDELMELKIELGSNYAIRFKKIKNLEVEHMKCWVMVI